MGKGSTASRNEIRPMRQRFPRAAATHLPMSVIPKEECHG
jgi:hypothetical protein